jgi:cyclic pyranopterin phosphate synthase
MIDVACIIFAGGKSSRMGQDKALLPFGEYNSLAEFQYERMKKIFTNVFISAKSAEKFDFTCKVIQDPPTDDVYAPTAGFVSVFEHLHVSRVFVLSVDCPFVDKKSIQALLDADSTDVDATIAKTSSGIQPMCGVYHRSLHVSFKEMLENSNHRLGKLLSSSKTNYIFFQDESIFINLNNPDEYKSAIIELKKREEMNLTHLDEKDRPKMVDVSEKDLTTRVAVASGTIQMSQDAYDAIVSEKTKKGPVIQTAVIAAIMGTKKTSELIPMCHPLNLSGINCDIQELPELPGFKLITTAKLTGQTGVEMEALTGTSIGLLTIYDMVKAIDKAMIISSVQLESKSGGKSGDFRRQS